MVRVYGRSANPTNLPLMAVEASEIHRLPCGCRSQGIVGLFDGSNIGPDTGQEVVFPSEQVQSSSHPPAETFTRLFHWPLQILRAA